MSFADDFLRDMKALKFNQEYVLELPNGSTMTFRKVDKDLAFDPRG